MRWPLSCTLSRSLARLCIFCRVILQYGLLKGFLMKKLSSLLAAAVIACIGMSDAHAARHSPGINKACKKVLSATDRSKFIYKNSAPLRVGGIGSPIRGFREEPTLIMNQNVSSRGTATILDAKGKKIGSCPWASAHGHSGGRYRCTMKTQSLRRSATSSGGKPTGYFKITPTTCVEVPDLGRCYGSVKGLCNRTLR